MTTGRAETGPAETMPLRGTHQPILRSYLVACQHPPAVVAMFTESELHAGKVLWACSGYRPRLVRLARDVRNFTKSPSLSQQAKRRVPEVADWLDALAESTPNPT